MTQTQDAIEILDDLFGDTPGYRQAVAEEVQNSHVAHLIYEVRTAAGLSQKELATKIGSRQSVISRLEDADYHGHSLSILYKIVSALGLKLSIEVVQPEDALVPCQPTIWKPETTTFKTGYSSKKKMFESVYGDSNQPSGAKPGSPSGFRAAA